MLSLLFFEALFFEALLLVPALALAFLLAALELAFLLAALLFAFVFGGLGASTTGGFFGSLLLLASDFRLLSAFFGVGAVVVCSSIPTVRSSLTDKVSE